MYFKSAHRSSDRNKQVMASCTTSILNYPLDGVEVWSDVGDLMWWSDEGVRWLMWAVSDHLPAFIEELKF